MKLTINQNKNIRETEIMINCASVDCRIRNLANYIRQYSACLEGRIDESTYYVPLDSILYIDSVDRKTFFYDKHRIYGSPHTLAALEQKVENTFFVRISKCCIVNIAFIHRTCPYRNHRLEIIMTNGEHLIATRSYLASLKRKLQVFHADAFRAPSFSAQQELLEHHPERSVYNAGRVLSFSHSPKRVAALSYENAELLAALGLAGRLVAIAPAECSIEQVLPQYQPELEHIPLLKNNGNGVPTLAALRELEPDFIFGSYYSIKTWEYLERASAADYKLVLYIAEGTVPEQANMESVYRDILNLGRIFHIEDRSIHLVEQMRRQASVMTRAVPYQKPVRVFVYDGGEDAPYTAMGGALENDLISIAGGKNVFGSLHGAYGAVTWQQAAEAAPDVIVVHDCVDLRDAEQKIRFLKGREELREAPAICNGRFVTISQTAVFPGIQNVNVLETFIRAFHPGLL